MADASAISVSRIAEADWEMIASNVAPQMALYPLYTEWLKCPLTETTKDDGSVEHRLTPTDKEVTLCHKMILCHLRQTTADHHLQLRADFDGDGRPPAMFVGIFHRTEDEFPGAFNMLRNGFPMAAGIPPKQHAKFFDASGKLRKSLLPGVVEVWFWAPGDVEDPRVGRLWQHAMQVADENDAAVLSVFIPGDGLPVESQCALPRAVAGEFELVRSVNELDRNKLDPRRWGTAMPQCYVRKRKSARATPFA